MDIKAIVEKKIDEIVDKIKADDKFAQKFQADPIKALEGVLGIDLPDDQIKAIIAGVRAKIGAEKIDDAFDALKNLFKK